MNYHKQIAKKAAKKAASIGRKKHSKKWWCDSQEDFSKVPHFRINIGKIFGAGTDECYITEEEEANSFAWTYKKPKPIYGCSSCNRKTWNVLRDDKNKYRLEKQSAWIFLQFHDKKLQDDEPNRKKRENIVKLFNAQYKANIKIKCDDGEIITYNENWILDSEYMNYVYDNHPSQRIKEFLKKR